MVNKDLLEFSDYLNTRYNMNTYIKKPRKYNYKSETLIKYILKIIIIIILLILLGFLINKYQKYKIILIIIYLSILLFVLINIYLLISNTISLKKKVNNIKARNKIHELKDIKFKTGDVLQCINNWVDYNNMFNILHIIFGFVHNLFVIEYKQKVYLIHVVDGDFGYDIDTIYFKNNKYLTIIDLHDYINYESNEMDTVYRVIPVNKLLNNDKIFDIINVNFNHNNHKFTFFGTVNFFSLKDYFDEHNNKINCSNFIFKLLYIYGIIKLNNFNNLTSDDFIFLKYWTNIYEDPVYFQLEHSI